MNLIKPLMLTAALILSSSAWAEGGADRANQHIQQLRDKAQAALVVAETAPPDQRQLKMGEHMQLLGDMLQALHADHPSAGMSAEQHLAWMEAHDKSMDDALDQMQREHKLMMSECHK
ncbi:MAG: co-regulatory protein PtrA N-terminal domain-containing protein [Pseudomonas sp.]|uniref:co-regulatory protein PtrA N-terminal domain-containing protein n=1 Tax=Pseudomonas sp. TaxID=306 RepID=UPI0027366409|nr:co-regulatory protein PtrA N-terminal domain-containing protein [Pseudomonas sp.]MDP3845948.1 co-regulatory protein PtrA N-terminal domain-containing protein [Pseudomonas sp.]